MRLHEQYTKEVHDELNYVATWMPTVRVAPGDVCTMEDYELRVVSSLGQFGIPFEVEDVAVATDIEYTSAQSVSIQLKAAGDAPPLGSALSIEDAGITLSFSRSNAILMRLSACTSSRIKNLHTVGAEVLRLNTAGQWPEGYVIITQAITAGASTIIISQASNAGMDLVAKGGIGQGALTLAKLDAGLQVKRESNIGAKFVAAPGLTPLAVTAGVQKRLFRPDRLRAGASGPAPTTAFGPVSYTDFAPDA